MFGRGQATGWLKLDERFLSRRALSQCDELFCAHPLYDSALRRGVRLGQLRAELSRVLDRLDAGLADGSAGKGGAGSQVNGRLDKAKRRAVQV